MVATAASSRPRFRTDLVAEPIDEDGQRFIDVIDPDTGNAFRFYEVEYSIACAMDGERDLRGLADWAREELGIQPSSDEIANVIATLGDLGYLEGAGGPMFGDELVQKGVVAPTPSPVHAPAVELGAPGALTRGWDAPPEAAHAGDVELGRAGGRATATGPALESMDVGLGAAGAGGEVIEFEAPTPPPADIGEPVSASLRRTTSVDDEEGPTHLPQPHAGDFDDDEVSVDLSEHLAIRPDDVKEAVRASQVMKAVDVPPELLAELGEREQKIAAAAEAAKAAAREAQNTPVPAPPVRNTPVVPMEAQPEPSFVKPPVELPAPVAVGKSKPSKAAADAAARAADAAAKTAVAPPTEKRGTSPVLIILLVLVILGAGAFAVWKYVLNNDKGANNNNDDIGEASGTGAASGTASASGTGVASASGTGAASGSSTASGSAAASGSASASGSAAASGSGSASGSAPTAAPTGTLHGSTAAGSADLKSPSAGTISVVAAPGTKINAGDVVVRLTASPRTESKIAEIDYDLQKRYPAEIKRNQDLADLARKQGNEALAKQYDDKVAERQKRVEERTAERAKYADELKNLEVKAASAGTVKKSAAKGATVNAGDVVATIDQGGGLTADLDIPGSTYKAGDTIKVASKKAPDQQVDCTVAAATGTKVTISCASDSGWADGTEITTVK